MAYIDDSKYILGSGVNLKHIAKVITLWNRAIVYYGYESDILIYTYTTENDMKGSFHMLVYKDNVIPFMSKEAKMDFVDISSAFFLLKSVRPLNRNTMKMLNNLYIKYMEPKLMNEGR